MVIVLEITLWFDPIKGQRENMTYQFLKLKVSLTYVITVLLNKTMN
jgi:hypothetical protein